METKCDNCGATIHQPPSQIKASKHHFCNAGCKGQWMSMTHTGENHPRWMDNAEITCEQCGRMFRRANTEKLSRNKHNFCSRACFSEWKKAAFAGENNPHWSEPVRKPCDFCGNPLERNPARVGKTERRYHFCNKTCRANWQSLHKSVENSSLWQGSPFGSYGPNWKLRRRETRKRDGYECQHCHITQKELGRALDVHHIIPFAKFGYIPGENDNYKQANELSNLITLCHPCHLRAEAGNIEIQPKLM